MEDDLELQFAAALDASEEAWRTEAGYTWKRYKPMIAVYDAVGTAKRMVVKRGTSPGFEKLKAAGRLDLTIEALVVDPQFAALFTLDERAAAQTRLSAHGWRR